MNRLLIPSGFASGMVGMNVSMIVVVVIGGVTFEVRWVGALGGPLLASWPYPDDLDLGIGIPSRLTEVSFRWAHVPVVDV